MSSATHVQTRGGPNIRRFAIATYPTSPRSAFIEWCTAHAPVFTANAAAIGLTPAQATAFAGGLEVAIEAENERFAAAQAAMAATQNATQKFADYRRTVSQTIAVIKTFAQTSNNPNVYNIAQIPAPSAPVPLPPPGLPTNVTIGLNPTTGAIELRWKCVNPVGAAGTAYIVRRRTGATSPNTPFEFIGVTGEKRFIDSTFTAGPDRVEYTVQAQRADSAGPVSNIVVVNFGLPGVGMGGGGMGGMGGFSVSTLDNPDHLGGSDTPIATPGFQGSTRKLRTGKRHAA